MQFAVVGISFKEAKESIRTDTIFMDSVKIALYEACFAKDITQVVFLSTCNRSECYFFYEEEQQKAVIKSLFQKHSKVPIYEYLYEKTDVAAYRHLFEVCAGYHSMVVGEDQIEGQVQDSYQFACELQACGKQMHRVIQSCFKTVKEIKTRYRISEHPLSIPYIAMQYIKEQRDCKGLRVLVIGSGSMAELMLTYLKQEEFEKLYVCNRHLENVHRLLDDERMEAISFDQRYAILPECDLIISATSSPHEILQKAYYPKTKRQHLIDLAMPRDIDETIEDEVHSILSIDDFANIQTKSMQQRKALLEEAKDALYQGVDEVMQQVQQEPIQQVISSLHQLSEQQAEATLAMITRKVTLSHHEQKAIERILQASFHCMVREPMRMLSKVKENQEEVCTVVKQLYDLEENA